MTHRPLLHRLRPGDAPLDALAGLEAGVAEGGREGWGLLDLRPFFLALAASSASRAASSASSFSLFCRMACARTRWLMAYWQPGPRATVLLPVCCACCRQAHGCEVLPG